MPTVISPFLELLQASKELVSLELSAFIDHLRPILPGSYAEIEKQLASYYLGCINVFEQSMIGSGRLAPKAEAIARLSFRNLHDLCAALHAYEVMAKAVRSNNQHYAMVYMDGVAALYQKDPSYVESWLGFLGENRNSDAFASRLLYRQYDEIGIVMNGKPNDPSEVMFWGGVIMDVSISAKSVYGYF
jgi:hypothetical protein